MRRSAIALCFGLYGAACLCAAESGIAPSSLPADDRAACVRGETQFRRAAFDSAESAFAEAARLNPDNARAWWGLGRIEEIHFRRERARDLFAKAYRLDPRDSDIVLSYLHVVSEPRCRATLLHNIVTLCRRSNPERAAWAAAQIAIETRLDGKSPARLASPDTEYRLPLSGFRAAGSNEDGLLVTVHVNGGKPVRLVLDTGARGILIDGRAAKHLGLEPIVESRLGGFGASDRGESVVSLARQVAIGELRFEDCLVEVSSHSITPGADGILGASLFERFRMRLDARERALDLTPGDSETAGRFPAPTAIGLRNLLLVESAVGKKSGWFLVDTGAAYTAVSREMAPASFGVPAELAGVRGLVSGTRMGPLSLGVGTRQLVDLAPVAVDLGPLSEREGVEISGVLGYPALNKGALTLDLRRGYVTFE